jgi:hypothetical protein
VSSKKTSNKISAPVMISFAEMAWILLILLVVQFYKVDDQNQQLLLEKEAILEKFGSLIVQTNNISSGGGDALQGNEDVALPDSPTVDDISDAAQSIIDQFKHISDINTELEKTNQEISNALSDKGEIEKILLAKEQQIVSLEAEKVELLKSIENYIAKIDDRDQRISQLESDLTTIKIANAGSADEAISQISLLNKQKANLRQRLEEKTREYNVVQQQILALKADLEESKEAQTLSRFEIERLNKEIAVLEQSQVKNAKNVEQKLAKAEKDEEENRKLRKQVALLNDLLKEERRDSGEEYKTNRGTISTRVLGVKGRLHSVAILFDISQSIQKDEKRWRESLNLVKTWLKDLPIKRCFVIAYAQEVERFPNYHYRHIVDNNFNEIPLHRAELVDFIITESKSRRIHGSDLHGALKLAYEDKNLDTIILFTDGKVEGADQRTGAFFREDHEFHYKEQSIINLCARNYDRRRININVIAVGDYTERRDYTWFLRELVEKTNGSFIGR